MGEAAQTQNAYLVTQLGADIPAFRGVVGVVWERGTVTMSGQPVNSGYVGNTPYLKPMAFTVRRILEGWFQDTVWNPGDATINTIGMNPAHIIYECLTNPELGMGEPTSSIDTVTFGEAADTFLAEGFGLRMMWNQQSTIEDFLQLVMDHVAGALVINHSTGLYELKLVRADYDPDDLPIFDENDIAEVQQFQRQLWGETVNELTMVFTDPDTQKDVPITVQDLANITAQGARVPTKISLNGIRDNTLAQRVAMRELVSRSTPLAKVTFRVNRRFWQLKQMDVFKFSWAELGIEEMVMRVASIRGGVVTSGYITVEAIEDIFGMPGTVYTAQQDNPADPSVPPLPPDTDSFPSVLANNVSTPPMTPAEGDRYYIPNSPAATGAWTGHEGEIAEWDDVAEEWIFSEVGQGAVIFNQDDDEYFAVDDVGDILPPPWLTTSPTTTLGDLIVRGATVDERLPVGTNGQVLTADSTEPLGVAWMDPTGGAGGAGLAYLNSFIPTDNTVANTAAETFFDSEYSIPATLVEGSLIRVHLAGVLSTYGSTEALTLRVDFGGQTVLVGTFTLDSGLTDAGWSVDAYLALHSDGATATMEAQGETHFGDTGPSAVVPMSNASGFTVDTTVANIVQASADWTTADVDNSIQLRIMSVHIENAANIDAEGGGGALAFRAASAVETINNGDPDVTIDRPTGTVEDDVMLACILFEAGSGAGWPSISAPSGWTLVEAVGTTAFMHMEIYSRVAGGSEPADYTFTFVGGSGLFSNSSNAFIVSYSGANISTPVDDSVFQVNGSASADVECPSVTATVTDTMLVCFFGASDGSTQCATVDEDPAMTPRVVVPGTDYAVVTVADEEIAATGATGTRTGAFQSSTNLSRTISILLRP